MEKIDLSTFAKEIKQNYDAVVSGDQTYTIYKTLKDSSLKPITSGTGDISEFLSEFEEGSVQFGIIGVNPFGSDVKKLLLLGWCPDSAPIKSKVSYAQNLSAVGKVLHYHVEVTARDSDDLDVDDIMKTVSNASGARYSIQSLTPQKSSAASIKPKQPTQTTHVSTFEKPKPAVTPSVIKPKPSFPPKKTNSVDGWGDEAEIKERDFSKEPLNTLPSAYKPTKVDINALRNSKPSEPVSSLENKTISINPSGGLTSLPKPKPSHSVLSRYNQEVVKPEFGAKIQSFDNAPSKDSTKLVGGLSRNFGAENGKTPAQLWAEKKGQYKDVPHNDKPVNSEEIEKEVDREDISLNGAKAKFEKLQLEADKEEREEEKVYKHTTSSFPPASTSSFPPPPAREQPAKVISSFPPPPARDEPVKTVSSFPPPPKRDDAFSKFESKDEEEDDEAWGDEEEEEKEEEKPKRSLPPAPVAAETPAPAPEPVALPTRPTPSTPAAAPSSTGKEAIAEYEYEKDEDNEIGFEEGEKITNIEFVDEDWWKGTNSKGENGLFPASYVTLSESSNDVEPVAPSLPTRSEPSPSPANPSGLSAVAEYDYEAAEDNELTFKEGDLIIDIEEVDEDWWLGSLNGERKLFPSNYVTIQ
ncbi:hypothetical protein C6P40_002236 [Pichia californica]|uniref:Actin-binding protein n=1 Tax=Pichia californica TaxID=460514 RepID=A0A9P7BHW3_9ASCO|nr:hypothetical protein C6P42_005235 [[Candida] californica]KAG0690604.1 hypothetical protein C6P40_002236 [[Candida] californica]